MKLQIRHQTRYRYARPASQSINQICLTPRETPAQQCRFTRIDIDPEPDNLASSFDHFGNHVGRFAIDQPHESNVITMTSVIETRDVLPKLPASTTVEANRRQLTSSITLEALLAHDCLLPSPYIPLDGSTDGLRSELDDAPDNVLGRAEALMHHIHREFEYDPGFSTLVTPIGDIIEARRGVCQDFAHLAIAALRRWGIPARYVSGYLETLPPPGHPKLAGADASHAWYAVYDCASGWHDFDPTNGKRPDCQYVTTAWGRDYADVTPIKGVVIGSGSHRLSVEVDVNRLTPVSTP